MGSITVGLGWDVDQGEVDLDVSAVWWPVVPGRAQAEHRVNVVKESGWWTGSWS